MAAHSPLTVSRVREVLHYDPKTGVFTWQKQTGPRATIGAPAGTINVRGYFEISVDGKKYASHRLAWLYSQGTWPQGEIDHINGLRTDNRLLNLRDVSRPENMQNRVKANRTNSNGLLGVSVHGKKWRARIQAGQKVIRLGTYDTAEAAQQAYLQAKRQFHISTI